MSVLERPVPVERPVHVERPVARRPAAAGEPPTPATREVASPATPARRQLGARRSLTAQVRRRRTGLALVGMALLIGAGLFGVVATHVVLTQNQFKLQTLQGRVALAQSREARLRLKVAELESPGRIVSTAEQRLKMVQAGNVVYLPSVLPRESGSKPSAGGAGGSSPPGPSRAVRSAAAKASGQAGR